MRRQLLCCRDHMPGCIYLLACLFLQLTEGVGLLLFEMCKGVQKQFHSCTHQVINLGLSVLYLVSLQLHHFLLYACHMHTPPPPSFPIPLLHRSTPHQVLPLLLSMLGPVPLTEENTTSTQLYHKEVGRVSYERMQQCLWSLQLYLTQAGCIRICSYWLQCPSCLLMCVVGYHSLQDV